MRSEVASAFTFLTVMMTLMFLTGNCETCNSNNQDYLGGVVEALGARAGKGEG